MSHRTLLFALISSLALGTAACDSSLQLTEPGVAEQGTVNDPAAGGSGLSGQGADTTGVDDRGSGGHGADDPPGDDHGSGGHSADDPVNHQ